MIVGMKKITLAVSEKTKENFLLSLRKEGVVHIKHLENPSAQRITDVEEELVKLKKAILYLSSYTEETKKPLLEHVDEAQVKEDIEKVLALGQKKEELIKNIQETEELLDWYSPWGTFAPEDIKVLKNKNAFIKLYRLNKQEYKEIKNERSYYFISKKNGYFYVAMLFEEENVEFPYEEVKLPQKSYSALINEKEQCKVQLFEQEESIKKYSADILIFKYYLKVLEKKQIYLETFHGMKTEKVFSLLQGYCPTPKIEKIMSLAKKEGLGYLVEEPDEAEDTPTLIKNPKWIRIISPVFTFMNTLPGYKEYDISLVFLVFFSLFFAMLIGDAGYGFIFLGATYLARRKFRKMSIEPFALMYLLSICTIVWGSITGTWFGYEKIAQLPILNDVVIEKINSFTSGNQDFMIYVCFIIGIVHLTIAHVMQCVKIINSFKALAQIGWISILWGLFFLVNTLILNKPLPEYALYLFGVGVTLVLIFSNLQKNIFKGMLVTLGNLPLNIMSSFSDIISYIRLFAVGYASLAVSSSFNTMALNIGFGSVFSGLGAALILFFAHTLNIVLGLLAVIVHGIRLNMLEFSGHLNMEWSGKKYKPFS